MASGDLEARAVQTPAPPLLSTPTREENPRVTTREIEREPCSHKSTCAMYSLFQHAGTLAVFQIRYCDGDYRECARWRRSNEGQSVPINLMPSGQMLRKKV